MTVTLIITSLVILSAAFFSSDRPDGLEAVAQTLGFTSREARPVFKLMPDYSIGGLDVTLAAFLAGIVGTALVFCMVYLVGYLCVGTRFKLGSSSISNQG